jgi:hypothetical protein
MKAVLQTLNPWGPLFFGLGFLAPLFATLLAQTGATTATPFSPAQLGLVLGAVWGLYAKFRGSWL